MSRRFLAVALLGSAFIATACHHKAAPVAQPTPVTNAPPPPSASAEPNQDSIRAAREAAAQAASAAQAAAAAAHARRMNTLADMIHFEYDKADLMPGDTEKLDAKIALLRQFPSIRIRITGNCDERGSDDYNIALGMRRAAAAKDYMAQQGIDASRIDIASLGREQPDRSRPRRDGLGQEPARRVRSDRRRTDDVEPGMTSGRLALLALTGVAACATPAQVQRVETRVAVVEREQARGDSARAADLARITASQQQLMDSLRQRVAATCSRASLRRGGKPPASSPRCGARCCSWPSR